MDLNNIKKQVSNLTLYDLKAGVRKMQNGLFAAAETLAPGCHTDLSR
jgi:epsin